MIRDLLIRPEEVTLKKLVIILALVPTALTLNACKRGHSKNPVAAVAEASKDKDLQKTFQSECSIEPTTALMTALMSLGQASVKSSRVLYQFTGNNITRTTAFYNTMDCKEDAYIFRERGVFKIDEKQKTNDGGKHIDFDFRTLTLVVHTENGVKAANDTKLCGKSDWSANSKEQDVTKSSKDVSCYGQEVPRKMPNVYRVDAGNLYLGNPGDKTGERPATLSNVKFTAK
jgi:hypothetical protein